MKVTFNKDYKRFLTVEEYEWGKNVIASLKDDETSAKEWAEIALNEFNIKGWYLRSILEAHAEITKNTSIRMRDYYGENTGYMDVCISGTAKICGDFGDDKYSAAYIEFWALLSEIHVAGDKNLFNYKDISYQIYIRNRTA